ncbi:CRAL-TRIO domain-containing protein [Parachaetomium inaequale]|uniref:CRAL-TRIO domain-containing protein n=1 Tax=Parachaetomium inaequale TaxID=2588326 RepID=A0AAN6PB46_9PEZI|nr:CRAL-TRIO domain-containing protein [Parachaetomium inaequale]
MAETTSVGSHDVGYPHGHLGHLTEEEDKQLRLFKDFLEEKGLYKPGPPPSHDDQTLLRFLRARKWSVNDAYGQFKDTEEWRQANQLDVLYDTIDVDAYEETRRLYPQWTGRRDRRGIPLYLFQIRHLDSKTVSTYEKASESATVSKAQTDGSTPQRLLRLFALYENLTRFAQPLCTELTDRDHAGTPITLSTNIVDVSQVSLRMFWNLKAHMQSASTLATAHYPETLDRIFIIGAPYFFSTVWGWIKRWFDPITVSKIFILSAAEVKPTLEAFIEPRNIPKQYGGELEFEFFDRPNVDPRIKEAVTWEEGYTDFPEGPAYWLPVDGGKRLACMAVGSKGGEARRERVCTVPVTFFKKGEEAAAAAAEPAGEAAAASNETAAPVDATADAAVERVQKLSIADNSVANEIEEKVAADAGGQPEQKAAAVSS